MTFGVPSFILCVYINDACGALPLPSFSAFSAAKINRAPLPPLIRAKATVLREAKDSFVCSAKANAPMRMTKHNVGSCAGDLLQIIKGCSAKPAHTARHGLIYLLGKLRFTHAA